MKIKIANIRKVLKENDSLNQELCLDPKTHSDVFNLKLFIRALEDIAEIEQEKLFIKEKQEESKHEDIKPASPESPQKDSLKPDTVTEEAVKLVKGSKKALSPKPAQTKFTHLTTVDEVMNETVTSA